MIMIIMMIVVWNIMIHQYIKAFNRIIEMTMLIILTMILILSFDMSFLYNLNEGTLEF